MFEARPTLLGIATASPGAAVPQGHFKDLLTELWIGSDVALRAMLDVFETSGVRTRHFALPLEEYAGLETFAQRNAKFVERARALNAEAALEALRRAGRSVDDVTHVVLVTTTGIATPALDALLINDIGLPAHVRRFPLWGLGCGGGASSLGLAADLARTSPDAVVLVVVVELCSLAFVPGERTKLNLVASALFGDGVASFVVGSEGSGLELASHRTTTWPDTLGMMGWDLTEKGLGLVLSRNLPNFARERMGAVMDDLRAQAGWGPDEQPAFAAIHPGGPKVLDALSDSLGLAPALLEPARRVMARYGNMSAPTCLFVLEEILRETPEPSGPGLYSALGPGFSSDMGVLVPAPVAARRRT